jgi:8-oxo-dGTP pyrophosphatase MutT (NUDIX family)
MDRGPLLEILADYARRFPAEAAVAARFAAFVRAHPDCFERTCLPGHVTGSAWIVSHDRTEFLLTHHRKLGRWLQLGGHADGDPDVGRVALREATEESGIAGLVLAAIGGALSPIVPIDLDAHAIPARGGEPEHIHYDVRYLVVSPPGARLTVSDESIALRWFAADAPLAVEHDESVARLIAKASALLA